MLSRRRTRIWALAGFTVFGGCLCWLAIIGNAKPNLSYRAKPLPYWFNQLPMTENQGPPGREIAIQCCRKRARHIKSGAVQQYGTWMEEPEVSAQAIRTMGTKALKFYLSKLKRWDGPFRSKMQQIAFRLGVRRFLFADLSAEREQAVTALILLKPLPENTVHELATLSTNSNVEIASAARCVLVTELGKLLLTRTLDETFRSQIEDGRTWR